MDIFSISLKALDYDFYPAFTKGELKPILDGIKQIYEAQQKGANIHLEISNLCLTARNDNLKDALQVAYWMLEHLNPNILYTMFVFILIIYIAMLNALIYLF